MWGICLTFSFKIASFCFIFSIQSLVISARRISTKLKVNIYQPDLLQIRQLKPDIAWAWWRPVTKNSCQPLFFDRNVNLCSGKVSPSVHFPPLLTALAGASSALLLCPMLCCPSPAPGALLGLVNDGLISVPVPCLHGNDITGNSFRVEIVSSALSGFLNDLLKRWVLLLFWGAKPRTGGGFSDSLVHRCCLKWGITEILPPCLHHWMDFWAACWIQPAMDKTQGRFICISLREKMEF